MIGRDKPAEESDDDGDDEAAVTVDADEESHSLCVWDIETKQLKSRRATIGKKVVTFQCPYV